MNPEDTTSAFAAIITGRIDAIALKCLIQITPAIREGIAGRLAACVTEPLVLEVWMTLAQPGLAELARRGTKKRRRAKTAKVTA